MANITILPQRPPSFGQQIATGLSSGLQHLANAKMEELAQRKKAGNVEQTLLGLGVDPSIAKTVPLLPEQLQGYFFQNLGSFIQQPQQQQQGEVSPVLQQLAGKQYEVPTVGGMQFPQPPAPVKVLPGQQSQIQQPPSKAEQFAQALISPQQKREEEKLQLAREESKRKERKDIFQEQQKLAPILHAEALDYRATQKVSRKADKMLDNLLELKDVWPGAIIGNLPTPIQNLILRNPKLRKLMADINTLLPDLVATRKGVATNYKLKLEELGKANLSMPFETAVEIFRDIKDWGKESSDRQRFISSLKDKNGHYPSDLEQRLNEWDLERHNEPSYQTSAAAVGGEIELNAQTSRQYPGAIVEQDGIKYQSDGKGGWSLYKGL